jgi:hypothetical protein
VSIANLRKPETYEYLPPVDFPPLPEAPAPLFVQKKSCGPKNIVTLQWADIASETGFHFYRNGIMLALLEPDAVSYTDYPPSGREYFYEIESINDYGLSVRVALKVSGCTQ